MTESKHLGSTDAKSDAATGLADESIATLSARFRKLYTGLVADAVDQLGFRNQTLGGILPVTLDMVVIGPAFPGLGKPTDDLSHDDTLQRVEMLDSVVAGSVSVWSCGGHLGSAHWGEIMTRSVMEHGCVGAVVDGGLRDTRFVLDLGFPVFTKFRHPASSIGRWDILEWNVDITIDGTLIHPGDWIFGDVDGVVVIPKDSVHDALTIAEAKADAEGKMRADLDRGMPASEVYRLYGRF